MEKKISCRPISREKNSCSEIPSEKKKTYTEQTIFHGEKCWKKILGCVQTDATTPNIVAPRMLAVVGQQCWARSIQPKFRPVRPGKEDHLKRCTCFFETFPVGPNRSIEFWTEISGNFGLMDRAPSFR